jgi:hypothetical protein
MFSCFVLLLSFGSAFFLDSTLYMPDMDGSLVVAVDFRAPIVDYIADDFLYITTDDYLYKIDPIQTRIIDKTPMPLRFNYLAIQKGDIILISSDEIIILDRENLGFKSGVGIDPGDHQPIIKDQSLIVHSGERHLYLLNDAGTKSTIRILDLQSGKLVKKATTERVKSIVYDADTRTLAALDVKNNLSIFDLTLKRKKRIKLGFEAQTFAIHPEGFSIYSDQGIFLIGKTGKSIDFQPIPAKFDHSGPVVLTTNAIVRLDTTTCRIDAWLNNSLGISRLLHGAGSAYQIGTDRQDNLYLIQIDPLDLVPLKKHYRQLEQAVASRAKADSLWYLQLGAFSNRVNAFGMYDEMRANGVPVIIDSTNLYRIKLGGFNDKTIAIDLIEKMHLEGWLVHERKLSIAKPEEFYVNSERFSIVDGVVRKE